MKHHNFFSKYHLSILVVLTGLFLLSGCNEKSEPVTKSAPAPIEVGVVELKIEPVALKRELPGRTCSYRIAEVRARVNGIVLKRLFDEGNDVKEGQLLYQIDPAPYQATLDNVKANMARAKAAANYARQQEERLKFLVSTNAVSQQDYDNALAAFQVAEADVAATKAAVQSAEINLSYTKVAAPIDGRIGFSEVTEGAYVQAGMASLMATIQQLDPIYVNLVQPSSEVLRLKHALKMGELEQNAGKDKTPVQLVFDDKRIYEHSGVLQFSDVTVDRATGSITLRVLFPNPDMDLFPGMFVHARFDEAISPRAFLIPQQAVTRNYRGEPILWVVEDGKAEIRTIKTNRTSGDKWIVTGGVEADEQVIVNNLQRLRPGTPVKTVPWQKQASDNGK